MKPDLSKTDEHHIPLIALVPFLLIAFGLAWGILALFIFFPDTAGTLFGTLTGRHPLFYLAVYAPAIAASLLVIYHAGTGGFLRYLSRLSIWRASPAWYAFLFLGIPLLFYAGSALKGNLASASLPFASLQALPGALLFALLKGPVEELGWRGFALPLLQRKMTPLAASLLLGLIWGFWHLPAFLLSGMQQSEWSFVPFLAGTVAISVIMTPLFNASRGSILLPAFVHFQFMNPLWPDAQPYDSIFVVAAALLIVWFNRAAMLTKDNAVTAIIPREKA
ncbi:CPBP family intramembrane glutamic endopeptidase [Thiomicrolovo sp. ZZH C-3]